MNFYTSDKDFVIIPVTAFCRNPKCVLSQEKKGKFDKVSICLKPNATYKVRKRNGEVIEGKDINSIDNIVGVEFEMKNSRHYFSMGNCSVKVIENPLNNVLSVFAK